MNTKKFAVLGTLCALAAFAPMKTEAHPRDHRPHHNDAAEIVGVSLWGASQVLGSIFGTPRVVVAPAPVVVSTPVTLPAVVPAPAVVSTPVTLPAVVPAPVIVEPTPIVVPAPPVQVITPPAVVYDPWYRPLPPPPPRHYRPAPPPPPRHWDRPAPPAPRPARQWDRRDDRRPPRTVGPKQPPRRDDRGRTR